MKRIGLVMAALIPVPVLAAGCFDATAPETPKSFDAITAGDYHTCALSDGVAFCWGDHRFGQLGVTLDGRCEGLLCTEPVPVAGGLRFTSLAGGLWHTCGISRGDVYCWGSDRFHQLGTGGTVDQRCSSRTSLPCAWVPQAARSGVVFRTVTAARYHSCALGRDGTPFCWGNNSNGAHGTGDRVNRDHPFPSPVPPTFDSLATGFGHTCGIAPGGEAFCWGAGTAGRLGTGGTADRLRPAPVATDELWRQIDVGEGHTCAVAAGGNAYCWGLGAQGQLGLGDTVSRVIPARVPLPEPVHAVTAGAEHSCAIDETRTLYCWGGNDAGQLGDGTYEPRLTPIRIDIGAPVAMVAAGQLHTCALTDAGRAFCWGDNSSGQLGDGTRETRDAPRAVLH